MGRNFKDNNMKKLINKIQRTIRAAIKEWNKIDYGKPFGGKLTPDDYQIDN